jgi:hypothetical protein
VIRSPESICTACPTQKQNIHSPNILPVGRDDRAARNPVRSIAAFSARNDSNPIIPVSTSN